MKTFNPTSKHPARAVHAWQILVGKAMDRKTITYKELSELMYVKEAAGVLDQILGHIAFYCQDEKIPPLTTIVVGKGPGKPGKGIPFDPKVKGVKRSTSMTGTTSTHLPGRLWRRQEGSTKDRKAA